MQREDSPRLGQGVDSLENLLRDLDIRLTMLEGNYIGTITDIGVTAVIDNTQLPPEPFLGDRALDLGTNQVYTADAGGNWVLGGTVP